MRKAIIAVGIVASAFALPNVAHAEYCYDLVGTTICTQEPNPDFEAKAKAYSDWVEEQSQISVAPLPEPGSDVIVWVPGPLLEGTPTPEMEVVAQSTDIGTPPTVPDPQPIAVATEPAVRVPVTYWTCKVNITI